ncbi:MAG: hypothetical protein ABS44_09390 [Chryseobacterium sp. SCN 40-13]|nr:MAG: hypothetical protein ABS44_09390 [Chryseobacterium sp. SCN 40-13]
MSKFSNKIEVLQTNCFRIKKTIIIFDKIEFQQILFFHYVGMESSCSDNIPTECKCGKTGLQLHR